MDFLNTYFFSIILPIVGILACIGIAIYSFICHDWNKSGVVALIIALVLGVNSAIQGIVGYTSSQQAAQKQHQEHVEEMAVQKKNYNELLEINAKIDSNLPADQNGKPKDSITKWVVNQRNDVIFKDDIFFVDIKVRKEGDTEWKRTIRADVGDVVEFQIEYVNRCREDAENIMVRSILPTNMDFVHNSTKFYNSSHQNGFSVKDDDVATCGINIGDYSYQGDAFVTFKTKVKDVNLADGENRLITWATITQNGEALSYDASVYVEK